MHHPASAPFATESRRAPRRDNCTYDAENRLIAATEPNMPFISYVYDGEGKRVQKSVGGLITTYVYDAFGQLAAEYSMQAPASGLQYLTADPLGSTRLVTDAGGNALKCYDYFPFGEEIQQTVGGRGSCYSMGVYPANPDIESQKFTGKERDVETGLDYFVTRYFSGAQGRFTSTDPFNVIDLAKSQETADKFRNYLANPQHWNKYAYVLNNPLRYTDPLGLLEYDTELLHKKIHVHIDDNLALKRQNELKGKLDTAIKNINDNESKLTGNQTKVLGNLKIIDVDSSAKRSFSIESKGAFTLTPGYVDDLSKAFLGSAIGHDAFHMEQFNLGGIGNSRGIQAEKGAFVFQLDFGLKIGITPYEAGYLKDLINDPKKLEPYYNSPIK